jgi:hypothetical protein
LVVSNPVQRRAAFAAADKILNIVRSDDALAHPIGFSVVAQRVAGITGIDGADDSRGMPNLPPHFGVLGSITYFSLGSGSAQSFDVQGGRQDFSILANGVGREADMDQIPMPFDNGPPVLSGFRVTGQFRGKPIYDGECTYVTSRTAPPLVPVTKERYLRLVMLGTRADSARHATDAKGKNKVSNDAYADWVHDKPKREADMRKSYYEIKKTSPQAAEQLMQAFKQQEAAFAADSDQMRSGNARIKELQSAANDDAGARLRQLQAQIDALSASERQQPVAISQHGVNWDFHSDDLTDINSDDAKPLVQINPASYDKTLAADIPQIIWVCMPGLQGTLDKSFENNSGDERESEKARAERRQHDAVLIRDRLDWAALEALVKR